MLYYAMLMNSTSTTEILTYSEHTSEELKIIAHDDLTEKHVKHVVTFAL